ncbi:unnamed protein product [Didymodactylos carnosus]|uniref:Angio-associated migratory cell protein n=1 Tax=Didymodactylos carnosus TaxID=1234261 RepID=A0A813SK70_9BILA|nr:unnamed protein product [Didymodactylos carnosus]CAF0796268.1 unnamed protein product [Didymodactylos carnosus]CAF3511109.1 unnamed protein product [Didymodactylos carnosus]CAF3580884.1 unnamed protein product [Didymodactylos carnosus]
MDNSKPTTSIEDENDEDEFALLGDPVEVIELDSSTANAAPVEEPFDDLDLDHGDNLNDDEDESDQMEQTELEDDDALILFNKHEKSKSVFCLSVDPSTSTKVISGGEDDKCFLWKIADGETLCEYNNFQDSIIDCCFSFDSKYVCAGDMGGQLRCWDVNSKEEIWSFHTGSDIELLRFHPSAHILLCGTNDSQLWLFKIPSGEYKTMHGATDKSLLTLSILSNGKQCICGYGSGQIKMWDLKQCQTVWQYDPTTTDDNNQIISMCVNDENSLVACGSTDVTCRIINITNGKLLTLFNCFLEEDEKVDNSVESVTFGGENLLICGTVIGHLFIWDVNSKQIRTRINTNSGIVKCISDSTSLYTACLDGHIKLFDVRNGELLKEWKSGGGNDCQILNMVITNDKQHILCSYSQGTCRIFKTNKT